MMDPIRLQDVRTNPRVIALVDGANAVMKAMGYTEHGHRHARVVSKRTRQIMEGAKLPGREIELGEIAAYTHDCGCSVNRQQHAQIGAALIFPVLSDMGMPPEEIVPILGAIGNHEESVSSLISPMAAALVIADKSDVHHSRVQNPSPADFDIHDRVNCAATSSQIHFRDQSVLELLLEIDQQRASVIEYFEIFLSRMVLCRKAANVLGFRFSLRVNGTVLE